MGAALPRSAWLALSEPKQLGMCKERSNVRLGDRRIAEDERHPARLGPRSCDVDRNAVEGSNADAARVEIGQSQLSRPSHTIHSLSLFAIAC